MGSKSKKIGDICICITDSLCSVADTNIILVSESNYTPMENFKKQSCHDNKMSSSR